jgi:hypothetical protein
MSGDIGPIRVDAACRPVTILRVVALPNLD